VNTTTTTATTKKAVPKLPEVLLKKRKLYADLKARRLRAQVQATKVTKDLFFLISKFIPCFFFKHKKYKRLVIFKRAERYNSEYLKKERGLIRLKRSAKVRGNYHVESEPALAFVIRIRGYILKSINFVFI